MLQSVGGFGGITYGARMNEYNVWGNPNESEEKVFKMHRKTFARFLKVLTASHKKSKKNVLLQSRCSGYGAITVRCLSLRSNGFGDGDAAKPGCFCMHIKLFYEGVTKSATCLPGAGLN